MSGDSGMSFEDGFGRQVSSGENYLVFHGEKMDEDRGSVFFLHGALHLTTVGGDVRKLAWSGSNMRIIDQVQMGLNDKQYPLVVSEGTADQKRERIQGSGYLYRVFLEFQRIKGALFVYGHSLNDEDEHIRRAIIDNTELQEIYVGIYGDQNDYHNRKLKERTLDLKSAREELRSRRIGRWSRLRVRFYNSKSASVWDSV